MTVVVIGRSRRVLGSVVPIFEQNGFPAVGVTTLAEARPILAKGMATALVIGAGVDWITRLRLRGAAQLHGVRVIQATPGRHTPETYVREEVIPRLRRAGDDL
ncbi:hypothetical protein [Phytoactinopolyspora limicola]|uniref:hypothetical protein n=1 Tax=Phytoactinopolyspora limicola TaxID=2715536 RepID=UPI00140CF75E|nr:hypothetical protein [Phytoactinopolyspora limicola]